MADECRRRRRNVDACRRWPTVAVSTMFVAVSCLTLGASPVDGKVTSAPRITEQTPMDAQERAYKPGEEIRLPCRADSQPTYKWKKDDQPLNITGGRISMMDPAGTLVIKSPSDVDDGVYQCFAGNQFGTAVSLKTTVRKAVIDPFKTVTQPPVHRTQVGLPLTLRCNPPNSYPKGKVYWGLSRPEVSKLEAIETTDRIQTDYDGHLRIANVIMSDSLSGINYVCIVHNYLLGTYVQGEDQRIEPHETPGRQVTHQPPAIMWTSPHRDIALKGQSKKLKCIFSGLPTPKVTWSRPDGRSMSRTSLTTEGHGTEIEIKVVDHEDAGIYRCAATNDLGAAALTVDLNLVVEAMPSWRPNKVPLDQQVEEDGRIDFECEALGTPKPNITWYINGEHYLSAPANPKRTIDGNRLYYVGVTTADNAVLQCVAANVHGHIVANAILTVIAAAPSFSATPVDQRIVEGDSAMFTCRVFGAPKPRLEWRKDGATVSSSTRIVVHSHGDLEIKGATLGDNGTYTCFVSNKLGNDSTSAQLIVRSPTRIVDPPRSLTVNVKDPIVLQCGVSIDPAEKLTVEWRRDGRVIDPARESARLTIDPADHSLTIRYSLVADTAQYTCHASNGLDSDNSLPATVVVRDRPAPPRDVVVSCTTTQADVSWTPGSDNNDAIFEFIVYYRQQHGARPPSDTTSLTVGARVSREEESDEDTDTNDWKALVEVRPWSSYEFYVTARNGLGESELSARVQTSGCRTPEAPPSRNPNAVCSRLQATKQLVITWEPLEEHEYNGRDFAYLVSYKLHGSPGEPEFARIDNPTRSEVAIHRREVFRKYEISVQSVNAVGKCPEPVHKKIGYSGEGTPMDAPQNFQLAPDTINSTHAEFSWDPVDSNPDRIQGFFRGYRIIMWRPTKPNDIRREDVILHDKFDTCPDPSRLRRQLRSSHRSGRQHRGASDDVPIVAVTGKLWPYSKISAVVVALNSANEGYKSEKIEFETPEGVAGVVGSVDVTERGSNHLTVQWTPPIEPNGIITSYYVVCQVAPPNIGDPLEMFIGDPTQTTQTILELESMIVYRISVSAVTVAGRGDSIFVDGETLPAEPPNKPLIGSMEVGDDSVLIGFSRSEEHPETNPGTSFYIEYVDSNNTERGPWNRTEPVVGAQPINVTDLQPGRNYTFRVVAINGVGETIRETRSEPRTVQVGREYEQLLTFPPPVEKTEEPRELSIVHDDEPLLYTASSGWFLALMIIIAILLLILLIFCIIKRSRGDMYPVQEKERLWGRDPLAPDDKPFGEYTAGSGNPDVGRSHGSLDSEEKPLDSSSETDSLGEYEDPESTKFNEDGSFIGLYTGQKARPPPSSANPPTAVNTFV